ncbi:MAG: imidazolonepropionase, partial [Phycisphaerales bacterium]|nr:imidazolonepropionase [Phycisphaerales bacterium]
DLDARGRVLMPAFVDCHTHACWAGDRLDEWDLKRQGATYLEILASGGGIMSTVRAVRNADDESLVRDLVARLDLMLAHGTCTVEVKSGYGLSTRDELRMLRAIEAAALEFPGTVVPTALLGHAIDPEQPDFVERTIRETLPAVSEAFPGITIDAYCEQGAWSFEQTCRLFDDAIDRGHPIRVHTDQFHALGMVEHAIERRFLSVDHLEATTRFGALGASDVTGVMLPCSGFHVDGRYGNGRALIDAGGRLCIATNLNPGSAPCASMPMAIALATRHLGISAWEAIVACTTNAAALLGFEDRGRIREGCRADLILLRDTDERELAYSFGHNPVDAVICGGVVR